MKIILTPIVISILVTYIMLIVVVHNLRVDVAWLKQEVWYQGKALEYTQQHTMGIPHNGVYSDK